MLHILFLVLKIIGIILLVLLGLLILALCIVLFIPVRYHLKAKTDDGLSGLSVHFKATWFLNLVSAFAHYEDKNADWQVRIFWKKLKVSETSEKEDRPEKEIIKEQSKAIESDTKEPVVKQEISKESDVKQETSKEHDIKHETPKKAAGKKQNWFEKIKCTIHGICDKIKEMWEMKNHIVDFLTDEIHLAAFGRLKKEILMLVNHLGPRKTEGFIRFGLEDPYNTGQVLAVLGVLYPFYGESIRIYPEFEEKVLEGNVYMKGHIRVTWFVIILWNLFFDHNVRRTYKNFKTIRS